MKRQIAGFRKGRSYHYSSSVTVTKGEQIVIWLCVVLVFCGILTALFVLKSVPAFILSVFLGIMLIFAVMLFCFFRKKHKEERQRNAVVWSGKVDEAWCSLTENGTSSVEQIDTDVRKDRE